MSRQHDYRVESSQTFASIGGGTWEIDVYNLHASNQNGKVNMRTWIASLKACPVAVAVSLLKSNKSLI